MSWASGGKNTTTAECRNFLLHSACLSVDVQNAICANFACFFFFIGFFYVVSPRPRTARWQAFSWRCNRPRQIHRHSRSCPGSAAWSSGCIVWSGCDCEVLPFPVPCAAGADGRHGRDLKDLSPWCQKWLRPLP